METIKRLLGPKKQLFVGLLAAGKNRAQTVDMFQLACRVALRYMRTGKIECDTDSLTAFVTEMLKSDCAAKWEWFMKRRRGGEYTLPAALAITPIMPLLRHCVSIESVTLSGFGNAISVPFPRIGRSMNTLSVVKRLAFAAAIAPICLLAAYATLPREKLSVYRLRTEARGHMEDEREAVECLVVEPAKPLKGDDGEDLITGSRLTKVVASTGKRRRRPYAAKIAQVARSKVGYLRNTPENRLIYQRVMIEIMDKDCVRYVDRDVILPLAIGCCFVYPDGVEESAALWGSEESLGVK